MMKRFGVVLVGVVVFNVLAEAFGKAWSRKAPRWSTKYSSGKARNASTSFGGTGGATSTT
jgi:hypothetical protein